MKTALITGANKGIGFEIARQLGQKGYHVFLSARNRNKGEMATQALLAEGLKVEFIQLDVSNQQSIQQAFELLKPKVDHLDVLINNAGILLDEGRSILTIPSDVIDQTFAINAFGVLYVTRIFVPLLKNGSRVVNVSSGAGEICGGMGTWAPTYSISKTTENAITMQLAHALNDKGILVNAVCPGWVRTDMGGAGANRSVAKGAETPVWLADDPSITETGKFFRDKKVINW